MTDAPAAPPNDQTEGAAPPSDQIEGAAPPNDQNEGAPDIEDGDVYVISPTAVWAYLSSIILFCVMMIDLVDVISVFALGKLRVKKRGFVLATELLCVLSFFLQMCGFVEHIRHMHVIRSRIKEKRHRGKAYQPLSGENQVGGGQVLSSENQADKQKPKKPKKRLVARLNDWYIRWKGAVMIGVTVADLVFYVVHIVCMYQLQGYQPLEYFMI